MNRATIRKLYREALVEYFGCGDTSLDKSLLRAVKEDIHLGGRAPGEWCGDHAVLEIYCENGIPNATDINDFGAEALEFGLDPSNAVAYNSDVWGSIDAWVNLALEVRGAHKRVYHEPYNGAVVGVYWS